MYLQNALRGCGPVASLIMVVGLASCADRPTDVSANRMVGRHAMLVEGGLSDGGMEGASASGTYTFWPPYGFSLVSPEYGDKGPPCYHDVDHLSPPDRPVTGACNAGTSVRAIGTVTPMTGVVPTPGQDAGVIIDPYKPNRPFSLIATQDVENNARYAVKKAALRKGFGNGLTTAVADRVVLSLDWRFATTEFNTGVGGNDAAWLEFKPNDGSPTIELLRISRNDLQPNGSGPLHPIALAGGVRRDCGAFTLGGSVANYVLCTDWSRLAIELTNPALTTPGTLYFRVEEADPPVTDVNGVVSPSIPDTPSAFLFDNLNLTRIVVSALENTSVVLTPGVVGMGSPPPDHNLVGYQWFIDERFCTLGTVATLENTTMTCTRPNRYIIALRRILQSTTLTLPNDPLVFVRDTLYQYAAIEITGPALIPGSATLGAMPTVPTEGQPFTAALSNVQGSAPLTFVVTCGVLSSNTSSLACPTQDNGSVAISGTIDGPGGGNVYSGIVQVANVPPTAIFGFSSLPVPEGTSFTLELTSVSDPGLLDMAAGFTYAFDCGDGAGFGALSASASRSCPTTLPGTRPVKGRVRDKDGGATDYSGTVTVGLTPVISAVTIGPPTVVAVNTSATIAVSFSDPGSASHTTRVTLDGALAGVSTGGTQPALVTVTPSTAGVFAVSATVSDGVNISAPGVAPGFLVAYDASAGFVTGAGWFTSASGMCTLTPACQTQTGRANVNVKADYKQSMSTPDGSLEFALAGSALSLRSTAYDWLVVANERAFLRGVGTVHGQAGFGFLVSIIDSDLSGPTKIPDRVRVKIWQLIDGRVVYDTQRGSPDNAPATLSIGGGNLTIHR